MFVMGSRNQIRRRHEEQGARGRIAVPGEQEQARRRQQVGRRVCQQPELSIHEQAGHPRKDLERHVACRSHGARSRQRRGEGEPQRSHVVAARESAPVETPATKATSIRAEPLRRAAIAGVRTGLTVSRRNATNVMSVAGAP
jgi:hypothetical protein